MSTRAALVLLLACGAAVTGLAASARSEVGAGTSTTIDLMSGNGAIGSKDAEVQWLDGLDWRRAWVIAPDPAYTVLPGTSWVFSDPIGCCPELTRTRLRIRFTLPNGFSNASITGFVLADNAATVIVNGNRFVIMPDREIEQNFQVPVPFSDSNQADFQAGVNTVRFVLHNFHGPVGLDFHLQVTYDTPAE